MSTLSLRLPESLHKALGELAHDDGISMNQFIATAVAEKIATLKAIGYLKDRASRGNRKASSRYWDFLAADCAARALLT